MITYVICNKGFYEYFNTVTKLAEKDIKFTTDEVKFEVYINELEAYFNKKEFLEVLKEVLVPRKAFLRSKRLDITGNNINKWKNADDIDYKIEVKGKLTGGTEALLNRIKNDNTYTVDVTPRIMVYLKNKAIWVDTHGYWDLSDLYSYTTKDEATNIMLLYSKNLLGDLITKQF